MNQSNRLVVFTLDEQRYALNLFAVERVVRIVEFVPLPKAPEIVLGVLNVQGRIIPVVNIRKRFRLPEKEVDLNSHLIIAHTERRDVGLVVDAVTGVFEYSEQEVITPEKILPGIEYIEGVVRLGDGIILIHNLDTFLSLEEESTLDKVIEERYKVRQGI
jgi:purine-binding chemotaxis protein CheW